MMQLPIENESQASQAIMHVPWWSRCSQQLHEKENDYKTELFIGNLVMC